MATTTRKTTKAKTKTSKATTSRTAAAKTRTSRAATAKKAPARSTTAKATSTKKAEAAKPAKAAAKAVSTKTQKVVTIAKLHSLHMMAIGVFVLLALAAGFIMNDTTYQLTVGHLVKDDLASTTSTVFVPAWRAVWDVQLRWLVVAIMLLSAIPQVLYMNRLRAKYDNYVQNTRMLPMRWFDIGITFALMTGVAALLSGVHDVMVLDALIGGLVFVGFMAALIAERQNNQGDKVVKSAFLTSLLAGVLPWLLIGSSAVFTVVYGAIRAPWYVYAVYAALIIGWLLMVRNQRFSFRKANNYVVVERNYLVINLLTKVAFAAVLIAGVR